MFVPDADDPITVAQSDPPRAVPEHVGRVLGLIRTFVAYGQKLAATLRQHADNPRGFADFFSVTAIFRTVDITQILDRIARGLLRAAALEARLNRLAARGRDLTPSPVRIPASRPSPTDKLAAPMDEQPDDPAPQADLAPHEPTLDDIIAQDRRRPIGAVLVDICHDLGIARDVTDRATWDDLIHHIIGYGGSLVTLLFKRPGPKVGETPDGYQGYFTGPNPIPLIAFPDWPEPSPAGTGPP